MRALFLGSTCALLAAVTSHVWAADEGPSPPFALAEGTLQLQAPAGWKPVTPRTRIVDTEFAVPAVEGDAQDGRVTVMGAGGTIEANIDRWLAQFVQPDGSPTKKKAHIEKKRLVDLPVHLVDVSGTYLDAPGPFMAARPIARDKYRMLAAIVETPKNGNYFIKFYGPENTVAASAEGFLKMIETMEHK